MKYMSLSSPFGIRIIIVSTCILVGALTVCAQDSSIDRIGPPDTQYAPNAAAIGQYGKVPVSYFNGLPNITIPLTEVKGKGITIPIYLSYHAGGNRTDDHPGWTGLGWTLHAGGCINRIVNGMKDEMSAYEAQEMGYSNSGTDPGNLYHAAATQSTDWSLQDNLLGIDIEQEHYILDHEPDEFQVCIEGISASFYIVGENQVKIVSQSDADFKVEWTIANPNNSSYHVIYPAVQGRNTLAQSRKFTYFSSFIITSKDGTRYTFGGDDSAIEYSTVSDGTEMFSSANSWHLTSIETPYGETVTFTYAKEEGQNAVMSVVRYKWSYTDTTTGVLPFGDDSENVTGEQVSRSISFVLIQPSYLTGISCALSGDSASFSRGQSVEASYSFNENKFDKRFMDFSARFGLTFASQNALDRYCQLSKISTGDLDISFSYSSSTSSRLHLEGISFHEKNVPSSRFMSYSVEYDQSVDFPGYNMRMNDNWGYYNGVSYASAPFASLSSVREPDAQKMKLEVLTKITYPTGGYSSFEWEAHTYSKVMTQFPFGVRDVSSQADSLAGGLRIKTITDNPVTGTPVVRSFSYLGDDGRSSGILSGKPVYHRNGNTVRGARYRKSKGFILGWMIDTLTFSGMFLLQSEDRINRLSTTNGNHVTYSKVTESVSGNGSTVYRYLNHDGINSMDSEPTLLLDNFYGSLLSNPFNSRSLFRGLLSSRTVRSEAGAVLDSVSYSYSTDTTAFIKSAARTMMCGGWVRKLSYVKTFCGYPYLSSATEYTYPQSGNGTPTAVSTTFTYDDLHRQVLSRTRANLNDSSASETVSYTHPAQMATTWNDVFAGMVSSYMLDYPVQTTVSRNGKVVSSTLTTWKEVQGDGNGSGPTVLYVPDKTYEATTDHDTNSVSTYFGTSGSFDFRFESGRSASFDKYDGYGNPALVTGPDGVRTAYVWENGRPSPSAVFVNADEVSVTAQEEYETSQNSSVLLTAGATNTFSTSFTCGASGTVTLSIYPYDPSADWMVNIGVDNRYSLTAASVSSPSSSLGTYYGLPSSASVVIPAGTHTITLHTVLSTASYGSYCGMTVSYPVQSTHTVTHQEESFLFEGFEDGEEGNSQYGFHSGRGHTGAYTVTVPVDVSRNYTIDYMVRSASGGWTYRKYSFSGTRTINEGSNPIDNVRVYPDDASAVSYTFDGKGDILSSTDGRGVTVSYGYDPMGRLTGTFDNAGDPITGYTYSYDTDTDTSVSGNAVMTRTYTSSGGTAFRDSYSYHDGLGRAVQTVLKDASPVSNYSADIVDWTDYDSAGRPYREWIPVPKAGGGGAMAPQSSNSALWTSFHGSSETRPFSESVYEASPLERETLSYGPGKAWHTAGKRVETEHLTNTATGVLSCRRYTASVTGTALSLSSPGMYPAGTLSVTRTTDEDGRVTIEFTDMFGQTVLSRVVMNSSTFYDTYYVYDAIGRLTAVLPPLASNSLTASGTTWTASNTFVKNFAYLYSYDDLGDVIARKLPGAGWEYYVYDAGGRRILSQDAVQRGSGTWTFSISDRLGRPCLSGTAAFSSLDCFSSPYRGTGVFAVMPKSPSYGGALRGYSLQGITVPSPSLLSVVYYDDRSFLGSGEFPSASSPTVAYDSNPGTGLGTAYTASAHGLETGSLERVLDGGQSPAFIWHVLYHDDRGRVVQKRSSTLNQGVLKEWYGHSITDEVTKAKRSFVPASGSAVTETLTYTYDNSGRPLTTTLILNGGIPVTVESNSYDGVGRLLSTSRAGNAALTSSFSYNVRSWMTSVSGSLFSETLLYHDGTTPQWGGNISSMEWNAGGENESRRYNFTYDKASRLTAAAYKEDHVNGAFSETYTLDRNGNLYKLTRYGLNSAGTARTALMSSLTFTRSGNRITKIGTDAAATVGYDSKGRMTSYNYGGTSSMTYNVLDLPLSYTKGTSSTEWTYSYGGEKLREKVTPSSGTATVTDHVSDFVFTDGALTRVDFAGGFADMTGSSPALFFFLTDHLGSVRVVADAQGNVHQVNHYYPYGDRFTDPRYTVSSSGAGSDNGRLFAGKEQEGSSGLYDFEARFDNTFLGRFTTMDPMAEKYYSISPYAYCAGNPVNLVDPDGNNPIYDSYGNFLGTDQYGLSGDWIVLNSNLFAQGMLHVDAINLSSAQISQETYDKITAHYNGLPKRPDYDGYVSMLEGIRWAKKHPDALKNPTPDNSLYINTAKLNFGSLSTEDFPEEGNPYPKNLFTFPNAIRARNNPFLFDTIYALGRFDATLENRDKKLISIKNNDATYYDWNTGGGRIRNMFIKLNNFMFNIDPSIHGFKVYYYGLGKLQN